MMYMGGKSRIARPIANIISAELARLGGGTFVSLFCGSCAVEAKVSGYDRCILNDKQRYLIALLSAVQSGYELPDVITEEQWRHIRSHKDEDPALAGFAGFGCSFGGKWFCGYARNREGRNYAAQSKRSLLRDMQSIGDAEILCMDYRQVPIPPRSVVYADPPYAGVTGYSGETFDSEEFWAYMRQLAVAGNTVYISGMTAPPDFACIWERPFLRTMANDISKRKVVTERLFTYYGGKNE